MVWYVWSGKENYPALKLTFPAVGIRLETECSWIQKTDYATSPSKLPMASRSCASTRPSTRRVLRWPDIPRQQRPRATPVVCLSLDGSLWFR